MYYRVGLNTSLSRHPHPAGGSKSPETTRSLLQYIMISKRGWVNQKGTTHTRSNETVSPGSGSSTRGCLSQRHKFADNSAGLHNYGAKKTILQSRRSSTAANGFCCCCFLPTRLKPGILLRQKPIATIRARSSCRQKSTAENH